MNDMNKITVEENALRDITLLFTKYNMFNKNITQFIFQ